MIRSWSLFSGCTVNELWTAVTAPPDVDLPPLEADVAEPSVVELGSDQLSAVGRRIRKARVDGWVLDRRAETQPGGPGNGFPARARASGCDVAIAP